MAKNSPSAPPAQVNLIADGTSLEGTLRTKDDIRVSGRLKGSLHVEGKVVLAQEGVIDGDVFAREADIAGTLTGEATIKERLMLRGSARIDGTIRTARLIMEEGATFDGSCEMGKLDKNRAETLKGGNGASSSPADATSGALDFGRARKS